MVVECMALRPVKQGSNSHSQGARQLSGSLLDWVCAGVSAQFDVLVCDID